MGVSEQGLFFGVVKASTVSPTLRSTLNKKLRAFPCLHYYVCGETGGKILKNTPIASHCGKSKLSSIKSKE